MSKYLYYEDCNDPCLTLAVQSMLSGGQLKCCVHTAFSNNGSKASCHALVHEGTY